MKAMTGLVAAAVVFAGVLGLVAYGGAEGGDASGKTVAREIMLRSGADRPIREYVELAAKTDPKKKEYLEPLLDAVAEEVQASLTRDEMSVAQRVFSGSEGAVLRKVLATIDQKTRDILSGKSVSGGQGSTHDVEVANESLAMTHLRLMSAAQVAWMGSAIINADSNELGEAASGLELFEGKTRGRTGVEVRPGETSGTTLAESEGKAVPDELRLSFAPRATMEEAGCAIVDGYVFWVFLPDSSEKSPGWVRAARDGAKRVLVGGSGRIGVNAAENAWCAYAVPLEHGKTGRRAFVIDGDAVMYFADNDLAKHEGRSPIDPWSAFAKSRDRAVLAVGTAGCDGEVWKLARR